MKSHNQLTIGVGLLVASTGVLLFLPKHKVGSSKVKDEAIAKMSKIATPSSGATWQVLESCHGFQQTTGKRQGDVTIFMKGSDYDLKQFTTQFTTDMCWSNLTIIPIPNPENPNAEKFLKLCLLHNWGASSIKQFSLAKGMSPKNPEVDRLWEQLSVADQAKLTKQLEDNANAFRELQFTGYYRYKGIYFASKEYIGATTCQMYGAQL